jgi:hypothetical protein
VPLQRNRVLLIGVPLMFMLHLLAMNIPFMQPILQTEPVGLREFVLLLPVAATVLVLMELFKLARGGERPVRPTAPLSV